MLPHNHSLRICLEHRFDRSCFITTGYPRAICRATFLLSSVSRSLLEPVLLGRVDYSQHQAHICLLIAGLQLNQKALTTFPDVVLVRVPTPSVQSDSDITVLRHLEKLGCRLVNRPQSILNCINKFWTFQELAGHGVPMPDTFSYGECPWNRIGTYLFKALQVCVFFPQKLSTILLVFKGNLFILGDSTSWVFIMDVFVAWHVIYPGKCFMWIWKECILSCFGMECSVYIH